jgi:Rieske Fe-S protein
VRRRNRRSDPLANAVADGEALPAGRLDDPEDVDALRAAIALKAAQPGADLPSSEFVGRLRQELTDEGTGGRQRWSRRAVLATAGAAAAGAAVAGTAGVALDRNVLKTTAPSRPGGAAQLEPIDGEWLKVTTDAELTSGTPQRFSTAALVGFVTSTDTGVVAVSAACTHLGCTLQSNEAAARFDCPCHRTAFGHDGRLLFSQLEAKPAPLTRLELRRRDGDVEVLVPRTV